MTTLLIAALTLGFAGSMHCIGMCGPLVMIVHGGGKTRDAKWWFQKALYHLGRISVYAGFGIVAGLIGKSFAALGFQQWLALISGALLLLMILWPYLPFKKIGAGNRIFAAVSKRFNHFLQNKTPGKHLILGVINGFLPCGLVYAAMAASIATGSPAKAALFMAIFGIATSPALFAVAGFSSIIKNRVNARVLTKIRFGLSLLAVLFILRGANLGIPYLSPKIQTETCEVSCCKR